MLWRSRRPSGLRKTIGLCNSLAHRTTWLRSDFLGWSDVEFFPQALTALSKIQPEIKIIIVTNQSAVGRGLIRLQDALEINQRIEQEILKHGGRVDGFFMCPHSPEQACFCRKPQPGLILQAARDQNIDLAQSVLVGDALPGIHAGKNAGIHRTILLRTGRGSHQAVLPELKLVQDVIIYDTLSEAVQDQPEFSLNI